MAMRVIVPMMVVMAMSLAAFRPDRSLRKSREKASAQKRGQPYTIDIFHFLPPPAHLSVL